ncbi:hypothetical protein [Polyangium aurulentum]|uniref:hypothetical protein n=1 Tax=Polyangium aurulentum TaxID=2567896 RepID=UPI0010AE9187|nr:hypothetical protein [Polyangium aurulentum]UQA59640.1 hypothetical protein E8A73_003805 [Polyangium aurulentum]
MEVYLRGKKVRVSPRASIGKGGEADIFDLGGGVALKLWKGPDHPDFAGAPEEAQGARARLAIAQEKLPAFPRNLPERVVAPIDLATDKAGRTLLGYTMPLVAGAEVLLRLGEPAARRAAGGETAARLLGDLLQTVSAVHRAGAVIGDFNDLNVLVRGTEARIVDADSFQFGRFPCTVFTERFLDPLLCDASAARPAPVRPFGEGSDWYAFAVMAMTTLLCVGPYGGVFRPKDPARRIPESARPLHRITVFHPEVRYPKPAIPYGLLPDDLLQAFSAVFERDMRRPFPLALLEELRWTRCLSCGAEHARLRCPSCDKGIAREVTEIRGHVTATRVFSTTGVIVAAGLVDDAPAFVYHEGGAYRREDGAVVLRGPLDARLHFAIQGRRTVVARGERVFVIEDGRILEELCVDVHDNRPGVAVNSRYRYHVHGGRLLRRAARAGGGTLSALAGEPDEAVGEVLAGQTRIWAGERLGLGFYRAGGLSVAFVWGADRRGIKETERLPWPGGQIVEATASLDDDRAWFFLAHERAGRIRHLCTVIGADGALLGVAEADAGDGSWLGTIAGKQAIGGALLSPTDHGIVRVEVSGGVAAEARRFPDTEPFVHGASALVAGRAGLWVMDSREIKRLALG